MTEATPEAPRSPGRPRSIEADGAIVRATLELLAEVGYQALTMEQVRDRSGVGKATIYRRYANKDDLVKAALKHLHHDLPVPEDTGSLRTDFAQLLTAAVGAAVETDAARVVPRLLAESAHDPELQQLVYGNLVAPRRAVLRKLLERGIGRGEVRPDIDPEVVMDVLVGSIIYRGLISGMDPVAMADRAEAIMDLAEVGFRPR